MKLLVNNIATLAGIDGGGVRKKCGAEMAQFNAIHNAWMLVEDGIITEFDTVDNRQAPTGVDTVVDAAGGTVMPSWCDSHTHIVYAGSREQEFVDKINGLSYAEIARRGGGILNSADRLHEMTEQQLYDQAMCRVREVIAKGTGAIEIKSGYGLNLQDELKMLRVIARIQESTRLRVVSTFLGAHAVGREYAGRQGDYVNHIINDMIPAVAAEGLANFVDVFCDEGFFTPEETSRILEAGMKYGMRGKIHGQELAPSGGVEVALKHNALSVDHLEKFVVSLACIKMRLQPAEAFNAATINGAAAMALSADYGSIAPGKVANFFVTHPISSLDFIPYAYTTPIIARTFLAGEEQ